jgi:hypothetical protein
MRNRRKTMTEREEFELVAKAAGINTEIYSPYAPMEPDESLVWNPKTDDGDSRRLQVDLGIGIHMYDDNVEIWRMTAPKEYMARSMEFADFPDKYAAVRAAVWDVALEVAKRRIEK